MKRVCLACIIGFGFLVSAVQADFTSFVIRNASGGASPTITSNPDGSTEFVINEPGMKAGLGSNDLSGMTVGSIATVSIERLDDYTRFTAGSGQAVGPYINIWITNGAGKYAVIANEPSNPEWQPGNTQWNMDWDALKTKTVKVYETSDKGWLPDSGVGLTFEDLAGYTIQAPTVDELIAGWGGLGTGAPRELGTNLAYAFNWVFGDTLANYVSGDAGYIVKNPVAAPLVAVPVPGAVALAMLGLGCVGWVKRRMA